jgi:hypothetical protein
MVNSLKSIIFRERAQQAVGLGLIVALALLGGLSVFWPRTYVTDGRLVEATVVRIGSYPVSGGYGGELPILTIRLPNGAIRQVRASWSAAGDCLPGSQVPLIQRGTALQVGLRGCHQAKRPA